MMGDRSEDQRRQPLSAKLGRAERVRDRRLRVSAERRLQPDRHGRRAGLLGGRRDQDRYLKNPGPLVSRPAMRRALFIAAPAPRRCRRWRWRSRRPLAAGAAPQARPPVRTSICSAASTSRTRAIASPATPRPAAAVCRRARRSPTPFGTIDSTNITPDPRHRHRPWTDEEFYRAMHEGIDRHGKHLYPAFPYPWYTTVSREDVRRDLRLPAHAPAGPPGRSRNELHFRSTCAA